jgi:hypothetical protein
MVRLTSIILVLGCMAAPMLGQTHAAEPGGTEQREVAPPAAQYPLDSFTEFSAVMVGSRVEPGDGTAEGHIYRSGKLMRMEDPGRRGYYITDLAVGETYGMSEAGCMHDGHPFIRVFPFFAVPPGATVARAAAGKETVDGHSCQIENVTVSSPAFANPLKMKFWEAQDLQGFPVKIEFLLNGGHDPIIRYKSVVLGPPDPTLFIHPKSCDQISRQESKPQTPPAHEKPAVE